MAEAGLVTIHNAITNATVDVFPESVYVWEQCGWTVVENGVVEAPVSTEPHTDEPGNPGTTE